MRAETNLPFSSIPGLAVITNSGGSSPSALLRASEKYTRAPTFHPMPGGKGMRLRLSICALRSARIAYRRIEGSKA